MASKREKLAMMRLQNEKKKEEEQNAEVSLVTEFVENVKAEENAPHNVPVSGSSYSFLRFQLFQFPAGPVPV